MAKIIQVLHVNPSFKIDFDPLNSSQLIASPIDEDYNQHNYRREKALKLCDYILKHKKSILKDFAKCLLIKQLNCRIFQEKVNLIFESADRASDSPQFVYELTSNWISLLESTVLVKDILFVGTHNACSFDICWQKKPLFIERNIYFRAINLFKRNVSKWVCNQTCTIETQFSQGVRLFDVRLAKDDQNTYFISHTFYLCKLDDFLQAIRNCVLKYRHELSIINFKVDYAYRSFINNEDLNEIFKQVHLHLAEFILPVSCDLSLLTLGDCTRQLIVYFNGNLTQTHGGIVRLQQSHELWPEASVDQDVLIKLNEKLEYYVAHAAERQHEFLYASFNTTPDSNEIIKGVFKRSDLIKRSLRLQSHFSEFLKKISFVPNGFIFDSPTRDTVLEILRFNFARL